MAKFWRYLRIAWTGLCGLACVLVIVLWVRSYFWVDQITRQDSSTKFIAVTLGDGRLLLGKSNDPDLGLFFGPGWSGRTCKWANSDPVPFFPASVPLQSRGKIFGWPQFSDNAFYPRTNGARYYEI